MLTGPKGRFALGRITELGVERELVADRPERDLIKLRFRTTTDLARGGLQAFVAEHFTAIKDSAAEGSASFSARSSGAKPELTR